MKTFKFIVSTTVFMLANIAANAQYLIAEEDELKKYTVTNDNILLHIIVAVFGVLLLVSIVALILLYRSHNRTVKASLDNELEAENAVAKAGILEKQAEELRNQIFELNKVNEIQLKKITDNAFESGRLINKIEILETEVVRKDEKFEEIIKRNHSELLPESKVEIDRLEINFRKLEKTKILADNSVISEKEYLEIKKKVLGEL